MMNVESERPSSAQGIQCGIARISIVASTGSPRSPRSSSVFEAPDRLVVPHVLVDLERDPRRLARLDQRAGLARGDMASGFWARMPADLAADASRIRRMTAGLFRGRDGDVDDLDLGIVEHRLERRDRPAARPGARRPPRPSPASAT